MADMANDMYMMHHKFGVREWFEENKHNSELMENYLNFRLAMCKEELDETFDAMEAKDPEEIVDGLIDLCVFAIGTLDIFGVDVNEAWDRVYTANMAKEVGIKEGRPNPFGVPDLVKPSGWTAPDHLDNHGDIDVAL
jgi:predicted HAD superfamily Cof-like phosphohydrolase